MGLSEDDYIDEPRSWEERFEKEEGIFFYIVNHEYLEKLSNWDDIDEEQWEMSKMISSQAKRIKYFEQIMESKQEMLDHLLIESKSNLDTIKELEIENEELQKEVDKIHSRYDIIDL